MKRKYLLLFISFLIGYIPVKAEEWSELTKTLPIPEKLTRNGYMGGAVSVDGDYAVIGSYGFGSFTGCAYILFNNGNIWDTVATLSAKDISFDDYFGYSVSISGETVVVGAYRGDGIVSGSGSVYVFEKPATGWVDMTETAKLSASDGASADYLGISVNISGETVVAGAYGDDDNGSMSGSAYIFEKPASGWTDITETAKLTASDAVYNDYFGYSVSISGNTVVVGAYYDDDNGSSSGSAYIFEKPTSGWADMTETAKLTASDGVSNDRLALSVSISGETVVAGAHGDDDNGSSSGSVYVFEKPSSGWTDMTETAKLAASDGLADDLLGYSVSISDELIVAGAYGDDDNGSSSGSAYIFEKPAAGWTNTTEAAKIMASDGAASDWFGRSVSVSGENVIVGASADDDNGENSGSVYAFEKPTAGWADMTENQKLNTPKGLNNTQYFYGFGISVDSNYAVIGSFGYNNKQGCAYVLANNGINWNTVAKLSASDGIETGYFGRTVSISDDIIVVGAYGDDDNGSSSGSAYIFEKPATGWTDMTETAKLTASDGVTLDYFGYSVDISDSTVVVGAYGDDDNGSSSGSAYIFEKPTSGWTDMTETVKLTASDAAASDNFGFSVSISVNAVVVGAYADDDNGTSSGSAYIFEKPASGWTNMTETAKLTASDGAASDYFGRAVDISGETVVIGAYLDDDNGTSSGSSYIFEKPASGWANMTETAKLTASDGAVSDFFGYAVGISGETVVIGAYLDDDNGASSGSSYIFEKPASGWNNMTETAKLTASDGVASDNFGQSVSISEETVIVGAYFDNDNGYHSGSAYFYIKGYLPVTITTEPENVDSTCLNSAVSFNIVASGAESYQWQVSADSGTTYTNITDNDTYSGSVNDTLTVITEKSINLNWYRCVAYNPGHSDTSNYAVLSLETIAPVFASCIPGDTLYADNNGEIILPDYTNSLTVTDNCGSTVSVEQSPVSGTVSSSDSTEITLTISDELGNSNDTAFYVIRIDTISPEITASPESITVYKDASCNASIGDYTSEVTATDNCDKELDYTQSPIAGTAITQDTTSVTVTVSDDAGNSKATVFLVFAVDTISPEITCIDDQSIDLNTGETVYTVSGTEFDPSTSDNCNISSIVNDFNNAESLAEAEMPIGTTTITWTVIDESGNITTCNYSMTVNEASGINELDKEGVAIYPNPVSDAVVISLEGNENTVSYRIVSLTGKVLTNGKIENSFTSVDMSAFETGVYFIQLLQNNKTLNYKVVKE